MVKNNNKVTPILDFKHFLQQTLLLTPQASACFRIKDITILIKTPSDTFNNYADVYAQLMVITDTGEVLLNGLVSINTDLDSLCAKIKKKIITNELKQRRLQYEMHV